MIKLKTLRWEDYPARPDIIMRVVIKERGGRRGRGRKGTVAIESEVGAMRFEDGGRDRGLQADSRSWESKETGSFLDPPEGMQLRQPILDI